jgi:hypothetical protein
MTITVTAQLFSGRSNPSWTLKEGEALAALREISLNPGIIVPFNRARGRLGYCGLLIDIDSEELATETGLPSEFLIHTGETRYEAKAQEIAGRLVDLMLSHRVSWDSMVPGLGPDAVLQSIIRDEVTQAAPRIAVGRGLDSISAAAAVDSGRESVAVPEAGPNCPVESALYNPEFWNDNAGPIQRSNNCYCYATNRRINKFGLPGKGGGKPVAPPWLVNNVIDAMNCDGAVFWANCLPDSEKPRYLIAMVIAPIKPNDPNYNDFHFYRNVHDAAQPPKYFWGNKPGQFPVTNLDYSNRLITNVERCDRGKYAIWGGYFYAPKSMRVDGNKPPGSFEDAAA